MPQFLRKQLSHTTFHHHEKLIKAVNTFTLRIKMIMNERLHTSELITWGYEG
jgi:hypothetical protein